MRFVPAFPRTLIVVAAMSLAGTAFAQSCLEEVGADEAQSYVDQCLEVSPATRPPCNAENTCQMMWDEITRGCAMLGSDKPEYCADYEG